MNNFLYLIVSFSISLSSAFGQKYGKGVKDIHGKKYSTVIIGNQEWIAKNLNVSKFSNGDIIKKVNSFEELKQAAKNQQSCWFYRDFKDANANKFGKYYNWYAIIDKRNIAPNGWHVPTEREYGNLKSYLGMDASKKLKSTSGFYNVSEQFDCTKCKNWSASYRRKVPCSKCKDKRYVYKNVSNNGNNLSGFNAKNVGEITGAEIDSRINSASFWTSSSRNKQFPLYFGIGEGRYRPFIQYYSPSSPYFCGRPLRCIKNSKEFQEKINKERKLISKRNHVIANFDSLLYSDNLIDAYKLLQKNSKDGIIVNQELTDLYGKWHKKVTTEIQSKIEASEITDAQKLINIFSTKEIYNKYEDEKMLKKWRNNIALKKREIEFTKIINNVLIKKPFSTKEKELIGNWLFKSGMHKNKARSNQPSDYFHDPQIDVKDIYKINFKSDRSFDWNFKQIDYFTYENKLSLNFKGYYEIEKNGEKDVLKVYITNRNEEPFYYIFDFKILKFNKKKLILVVDKFIKGVKYNVVGKKQP
tara:strand:- start:1051 stop:2634 length:1584 start_codon:yes stop_codon:yes gene_type:complete